MRFIGIVLATMLFAFQVGNAIGDVTVTDDFDTWDSGRTWVQEVGSMAEEASSPVRSGSSAFVSDTSGSGISSTSLDPNDDIGSINVWVYDDQTSTSGGTPVQYMLYVRPSDQSGGYMYFGFWHTQSTTHYAYSTYASGVVTSSLPRVSQAGWINLRALLINDTIKLFVDGTQIYSGAYTGASDFNSTMLLGGIYVDANQNGACFDDLSVAIALNGDADGDGDVDNVDFGTLYGNYSGPGMPTDPNTLLGTDDPNRADLLYDPQTGHVTLDASDANGDVITSYAIENDDGLLNYWEADLYDFNDSMDTTTPYQISQTDLDQDGLSGTWDLGNIFPEDMTLAELEAFVDTGQYSGDLGSGYYDLDLLCFEDDSMYWPDGDFDGDGDVDNVDFGILYGNYTGPAAGGMDLQVSPEPVTLALLGLGGLGLLRRGCGQRGLRRPVWSLHRSRRNRQGLG